MIVLHDEAVSGLQVFFHPAEQDVFFVGEGVLCVFLLVSLLPLLLKIEVVFFVRVLKGPVSNGSDPAHKELLVVADFQHPVQIIMERAFVIGINRGERMFDVFFVPRFARQGIGRVIGVPRIGLADAAFLVEGKVRIDDPVLLPLIKHIGQQEGREFLRIFRVFSGFFRFKGKRIHKRGTEGDTFEIPLRVADRFHASRCQ